MWLSREIALRFASFNFVAAEILLRLLVDLMLTRYRVVLLESQLLSCRLGILNGIVRPVSRRCRHKTHQLPLGILLICHN